MGDRAPVHITIGGALRRDLLSGLAACAEEYDLRAEWDGAPFDPAIVVFDGTGPMRDYTASEDEYVLFPPSWIRGFTRLRDLKRAMAKAEITVPPLVIISRAEPPREGALP